MHNQQSSARLQNLRDFTVQIRCISNDQIVGTGVVVSSDLIVTCAHVIRAAGVEPRAADDAEVGVYFPQAPNGNPKLRQARVKAYFSQYDDDVILLQLIDGLSPLEPRQFAVLGRAELSHNN